MRGGVGSLEGQEIMNPLGGLVKQRAYMCKCGRLTCSLCWAGPWMGTGLSSTEGPGDCPLVIEPVENHTFVKVFCFNYQAADECSSFKQRLWVACLVRILMLAFFSHVNLLIFIDIYLFILIS